MDHLESHGYSPHWRGRCAALAASPGTAVGAHLTHHTLTIRRLSGDRCGTHQLPGPPQAAARGCYRLFVASCGPGPSTCKDGVCLGYLVRAIYAGTRAVSTLYPGSPLP